MEGQKDGVVAGENIAQLGEQLLIELGGCKLGALTPRNIIDSMLEAARVARATIISSSFQLFGESIADSRSISFEELEARGPEGVSGVVIIAESHLTIHTWPEYCYAAVDIFTCGKKLNPAVAAEYLEKAFGATNVRMTPLLRGIPGGNGILPHKPEEGK